jgi:glyoxylase-like metal-dependent hydrolase (beta-lactamase superfamily II)/8-oxo-dGTP pyrophosphatase MutT (NUDIX family)
VSQITEAASVVLAHSPDSAEVLVVRRSDSLRFFGGYHAFPGGKVSAEDTSIADPRRAAAARELFEETGILIARRADRSLPTDTGLWTEQRRELLADRLTFTAFLQQAGLKVHADDFLPAGSLVTPPFSTLRFDTAFFVATLPPGQKPEVWPGELTAGFFTSAADLLTRWRRGDCLVTPPTVSILECLRDRPVRELPSRLAPLLERLRVGALPPIPFLPGVFMLPLRTVGLPSAVYTNAFLVGTETRWLIDPGAHEPEEQARLFEAIDALLAEGGRFAGIVLTHWHPDHVGGVTATVQRYALPVWAHPHTAARLADRIQIDHTLEEGDQIDLGMRPDGSGPWHLEARLTPGHAGGHLVFYDPYYRFLLAGDLVSMLSSVVIAPPDGDLQQYLESLRRIRALEVRMLLPAHGTPTIRAQQVLDDALAHRVKREAQLLEALSQQPGGPDDLAARLYEGLPVEMQKLARWQVEAGLEKLRREGRVVETNGAWRLHVHDFSVRE